MNNRKKKKLKKQFLGELWRHWHEPWVKHWGVACKRSRKYFNSRWPEPMNYDGFYSVLKKHLDPLMPLQQPKVVYTIDKEGKVNPKGLCHIVDFLQKQEI